MAGEMRIDAVLLGDQGVGGEVDAAEGDGGVEHAHLAAGMLERRQPCRWLPGSTTARCCSRRRRGRSRRVS